MFNVKSDGVLEKIGRTLADAPNWLPRDVGAEMIALGERVVANMQEAIEPNRYTGALSESITAEYNAGKKEIVISPKAMRGKWDAGLLLEMGVPRPIPNAPYGPIKKWADFRGAPMPGVWLKIRAEGVAAHPFLQRTIQASRNDIEAAGEKMGARLAAKAVTV